MKRIIAKRSPQHKKIDYREPLFNDGKVGPIKTIQVSTERVVEIRGVLFDLDPPILRTGSLIPTLNPDPAIFYQDTVKGWLEHHPALRKAEVRMTGTGLHVIPWFSQPVPLKNDQDRQRWAAIIQVVQAALPVDPHAPGITATTRAIGSLNSKNEKPVVRLKKSEPVEVPEILALYDAMCDTPFQTVLTILTGDDHVSPCPFCLQPGSCLTASEYVGRCYQCGRIPLDRLYDLVFCPLGADPQKGA